MDPAIFAGKAVDLETTIALFGKPFDAGQLRTVYRVCVEQFAQLRYRANIGAVGLLKARGRTYGRYRRLTATLEQLLNKENLVSVEVAHVPPPQTDAGEFGLLQARFGNDHFVLTAKQWILDPHDAAVTEVLATISKVAPAVYGYGYVLDLPYGPGFHATGIGFRRLRDDGVVPRLPDKERERGARWSNRREEALPMGILRDVYPLNYLTEIHAAKKIDGRPLLDWIAADASRGNLSSIRDGAWLWRVPEESCVEIGRAFEAAGLLI